MDALEENAKQNKARMDAHHAREMTRVRKVTVWAIFGFIVIVQIGFFLWYKKRRQQELSARMRSSVDDAVAQYMRVGVDDTAQDGGAAASSSASQSKSAN